MLNLFQNLQGFLMPKLLKMPGLRKIWHFYFWAFAVPACHPDPRPVEKESPIPGFNRNLEILRYTRNDKTRGLQRPLFIFFNRPLEKGRLIQ